MMQRRNFLAWGLGGVAGSATNAEPLQWRERAMAGLGTMMAVRVGHADTALAERALDAVRDTVRHVEDQMSLFRQDSALCQLNRTGVLRNPHPDLVEVLQLAQSVSSRSQGAFDVTVQPLWLAFADAQRSGALPDAGRIRAARALVNWRELEVTPQTIRLKRKGMGITLNGIAQGFAADLVKARLTSLGISHALINTGEWSALGRPQPRRDWTLGIANPRDDSAFLTRIALDGRCVATSADNLCSFSSDHWNHHIFDPSTGHSPLDVSGVSVLASRCALADALTKVMFVAGFEPSLRLAAAWGVDVLVVDKSGHWKATSGLTLMSA